MKTILGILLVCLSIAVAGLFVYGATGWIDAARDAPALAERANALIADGRGGADLGAERMKWLLMVQDPGFYDHGGFDLDTPGSGLTTVTQSLTKRVAFDTFQPGIGKVRQTAYAMSLERHLTKDQILALFLETVPMGQGPNGWMVGFHTASQTVFGAPPQDISDEAFVSLVAVMIAPGRLKLTDPDDELTDRTTRIGRLVAGQCMPDGQSDVWLDGCR